MRAGPGTEPSRALLRPSRRPPARSTRISCGPGHCPPMRHLVVRTSWWPSDGASIPSPSTSCSELPVLQHVLARACEHDWPWSSLSGPKESPHRACRSCRGTTQSVCRGASRVGVWRRRPEVRLRRAEDRPVTVAVRKDHLGAPAGRRRSGHLGCNGCRRAVATGITTHEHRFGAGGATCEGISASRARFYVADYPAFCWYSALRCPRRSGRHKRHVCLASSRSVLPSRAKRSWESSRGSIYRR